MALPAQVSQGALIEALDDPHLKTFIKAGENERVFFEQQKRLLQDLNAVEDDRRRAHIVLEENAGNEDGLRLLRKANERERRLLAIILKMLDKGIAILKETKMQLRGFSNTAANDESIARLDMLEMILRHYTSVIWRESKLLVEEAQFISSPTHDTLIALQKDRASFFELLTKAEGVDENLEELVKIAQETRAPLKDAMTFMREERQVASRQLETMLGSATGAVAGTGMFYLGTALGAPLKAAGVAVVLGIIGGVVGYLMALRKQVLSVAGTEKSATLKQESERLLQAYNLKRLMSVSAQPQSQ